MQRTGEDQQAARPETTAARERAVATEGETKTTSDSRAAWDYVALNGSLAAGVGARGMNNRPLSERPIASLKEPGRTCPAILHVTCIPRRAENQRG